MKSRSTIACLILTLLASSYVYGQFAEKVNPLLGNVHVIGGDGVACGYTYSGATYPFGMVQATPTFFQPEAGFVTSQLSGAGCSHMGHFPLLASSQIKGKHLTPYRSGLNGIPQYIEGEAGYAHYVLSDGTTVRVTATERVAYLETSFVDSAGVIYIGSGFNSSKVDDSWIRVLDSKRVSAYARGGEFCGSPTPYPIYIAMEFDVPASNYTFWKDDKCVPQRRAKGKNASLSLAFQEDGVLVRMAISYVSEAQAWKNLSSSTADDFDEARAQNNKAWDAALGSVEVFGGSNDDHEEFYSHLYHALIHPNLVSDIDGQYLGGNGKVYQDTLRPHYSSFSVWDTYRTQGPLLALLFPDKASDMMQSLVDFADQTSGLGRWILANVETGIMQGDPTSILIASSYAFGADDFDVLRAFYHMKNAAFTPRIRSQKVEVRPFLEEYMRDGHTFASMALEYYSADHAIAQFARDAFPTYESFDYDAASQLHVRAKNWKQLYNAETTWLNSRYPNGQWKAQDHDWREGTYSNYFWMVPHDLESLIDTMGGKDAAHARLDSLFTILDATYHEVGFAAGNEPDFQVPWIYNLVDCPSCVDEVIDRIMEEEYHLRPDGLPGNDDLGAMGAWYVWASLGMYPMVPGEDVLFLSTPRFDSITVNTNRGLSMTRYASEPTFGRDSYILSLSKWKQMSTISTREKLLATRIAFMGNSITEHWANDRATTLFYEGRWINAGISGHTTTDMIARLDRDVLHYHPEVMVICAGTNDVAGNDGYITNEDILQNIFSMVERAQGQGIEVAIASIPPTSEFVWAPNTKPKVRIPALNKALKAYAEQHNLVYIDYFEVMADAEFGMKQEYTYDGCHPNAEGYRIMEEVLMEALGHLQFIQ